MIKVFGYIRMDTQTIYRIVNRLKEINPDKVILYGINLMNATNRVKIKPGQCVLIVLKKNQRSGKLTEGIVKDILTKSPTHPHGIKVRLESGEVGRVKEILE